MAELDAATAFDVTQGDITFDASKVIINFSHGAAVRSKFLSSYSCIERPTCSVTSDLDRMVDGSDFLKWQRGESPIPLSASDLVAWQNELRRS